MQSVVTAVTGYRYKMLLNHSVALALKYFDDIVLNVDNILIYYVQIRL